MPPSETVKSASDSLMSGGSRLMCHSLHSAIYSASSSGEPVYIKALVESVELKKGYMPTIAENAIEVGIN